MRDSRPDTQRNLTFFSGKACPAGCRRLSAFFVLKKEAALTGGLFDSRNFRTG
jgi:hypothetical protein